MRLDASPLTALAEVIGIDLPDLKLGDSRERFERSPVADRARLAGVPWTNFEQILAAYGEAIRLVLDYEDAWTQSIDLSLGEVGWDECRSALEPIGQYRMRISIEKAHLLELAGLCEANISHFFFASTFLTLLGQGLPRLETEIWRVPDTTALILVGDTDMDLDGPLLHVVGGSHLNGVTTAPSKIPPATVSALREASRELVSVEAPAISQLTPWHVQIDTVTVSSPMAEELRTDLAASYAQLCLLSVCDRSRASNTDTAIRLEFRGSERLASVTVDRVSPRMQAVTDAELHALHSIVAWCYDDVLHPSPRTWTQQRVQFVQVRVARLVGAVPEADRLAAIFRALIEIDATKDVFWKAFLEETVSDYLDHLRELDDVVDSTADAYGERTANITDQLTTSMLAAVAALIGSFIAAAFSKPFNADLFRVGMWTYAVYLAVFPGGLGLFAQHARYYDLGQQFTHRREQFDSLLGSSYVQSRVGARIENSQNRWRRLFTAAAVLYIIVVAGAITGGAELPSIVSAAASSNVSISHATKATVKPTFAPSSRSQTPTS
jgi:hypothetical protein